MFVFFDIGDTLIDESDFARFRRQRVFEFLTQHGVRITAEEYDTDLNSLSMRGRMTFFDQLRWLTQRGGASPLLAMAVFRDYILHIAPEAPRRFQPFADARDCLRALVESPAPRYSLGIIANQPTWIRASMREWGLLDFFEADCVVISDEVAVSKPSSEIFQFALAQAGVPATEALMVGNDYLHDIEPAKWLGMRTVWIEREDHYAPGAPPIENPWAADARVASLAEVPAALARLPAANGHDPRLGASHRATRAPSPKPGA
ncbi:MAG: HAD family hydrolase [Ktedonobacterales bacterium]|nr:HAD family hydrolase [Ktedonobacterales bacterium]